MFGGDEFWAKLDDDSGWFVSRDDLMVGVGGIHHRVKWSAENIPSTKERERTARESPKVQLQLFLLPSSHIPLRVIPVLACVQFSLVFLPPACTSSSSERHQSTRGTHPNHSVANIRANFILFPIKDIALFVLIRYWWIPTVIYQLKLFFRIRIEKLSILTHVLRPSCLSFFSGISSSFLHSSSRVFTK